MKVEVVYDRLRFEAGQFGINDFIPVFLRYRKDIQPITDSVPTCSVGFIGYFCDRCEQENAL